MVTNILENGAFLGSLDEWITTGAINRALGYPRLGCVELEAGETLTQEESLTEDQLYTLHFFYRPADTGVLTAGFDATTTTFAQTTADQWHEGVFAFALDVGATANVLFSVATATVYVDTVTLLAGGLPITRAALAGIVAADIAELATDASLTTTVAAAGPEGDYSRAIDEALRQLGAVNRYGDPDITQITAAQVNDLIEAAKRAMYQRLQSKYALQVDVALGPRRESFSQKAKALETLTSGGAGDRRVKMGNLLHSPRSPHIDYNALDGNWDIRE